MLSLEDSLTHIYFKEGMEKGYWEKDFEKIPLKKIIEKHPEFKYPILYIQCYRNYNSDVKLFDVGVMRMHLMSYIGGADFVASVSLLQRYGYGKCKYTVKYLQTGKLHNEYWDEVSLIPDGVWDNEPTDIASVWEIDGPL